MLTLSTTTTFPADATRTDDPQRAKIEKAAVQFEGLFIRQMLKEMRRSADEIAGDDAIFKPHSDNGLLDLADTMLADAMAGQRAFGIADTIVRQMLPAEQAPLNLFAPPVASAEDTPSSSTPDHQGPLP
jgi:flagellar protein FlgJ